VSFVEHQSNKWRVSFISSTEPIMKLRLWEDVANQVMWRVSFISSTEPTMKLRLWEDVTNHVSGEFLSFHQLNQ
jgi:hypothetical protein